MTPTLRSLALPLLAAGLLLSGCSVSTHKNGKNDNVDISTPFGSMQVKGGSDTSSIGLATYPGAVPDKQSNGKDEAAADINMSFGNFHLGVKAASFLTPDSQDKVLAFYRKDLARYGDVIECRGNNPVGSPTRTAQGLTCDTKNGNHVNTHTTKDSDLELRAGSEQHQHIVGVETKNGGTKFGLVMLDLPSHLSDHNGKDIE
jgi:hypothetical protein